jgi:integrase
MKKTKYTGVFEYITKDGIKTYYIKYSVKGKQHKEKVGTSIEGVTALYASKMRAKRTSVDRLKEDAPMLLKQKAMTFDEAFNLYYETIKTKSDGQNIKNRYTNHVKPFIGHFRIDEISSNDVESFKDKIRSKKKSNGDKYAPKTKNDWIDIIGTVYNYLIKKRNFKITNPADHNKVEREKVDNYRERYLELHEIEKLWDTIDNRVGTQYKAYVTEYMKIFLALSLSTGARLSSVLTIAKSDINLDADTILIKNHKSNRTYYGYLHPVYKDLIESRMAKLSPIDFLVSGTPNVLSRNTPYRVFQPIFDELFNQGLKADDRKRRVVIHTLRHTFASQLAIQGTPIFTIMKLMDHADISQTIRYAKLSPENGKNSVFDLKLKA